MVDLEGDPEGGKAFAFLVVVGMCQKTVETQEGVQIEVASYLARVLVVLLQALLGAFLGEVQKEPYPGVDPGVGPNRHA